LALTASASGLGTGYAGRGGCETKRGPLIISGGGGAGTKIRGGAGPAIFRYQ